MVVGDGRGIGGGSGIGMGAGGIGSGIGGGSEGQGMAKRQRVEFNPSRATMLNPGADAGGTPGQATHRASLPSMAEVGSSGAGADATMDGATTPTPTMSRSLPNLTSASSSTQNKSGGGRGSGSGSSSSNKKGPAPGTQIIYAPRPSDVLFGRGGGTNVHVGNKTFRDLINAHRRLYLKARKNDKPHITQQILRAVQETHGGRFLKKAPKGKGRAKGGAKGGAAANKGAEGEGEGDANANDATGYYEVDDSTAKEKISQALRQRAPELKKLIFKDQFGAEEIDYGTGNVVPVIFHPNPAENAYLRSLSVGLFAGGTEQVGQSHHAIEEAAKRRRMQEGGQAVPDQVEMQQDQQNQHSSAMQQELSSGGVVPTPEQQQMLAQMQQVQMQLDHTAYVGEQQGLIAGDTFTAPLNDSHTFAAPFGDINHSSASTPTPAAAAATVGGGNSMVQGLDSIGAAFEPLPFAGMELAMLTQEQERKIKMIEIQRLRLQKQQLELRIAQQQHFNKATFGISCAPMPAALDAYAPAGGGFFPTASAPMAFPTGAMGDGMVDNAQLAHNESEGATPPSSLLSAMTSSQHAAAAGADKLSSSDEGSPQVALTAADGTGGATPQFNPFGGMQA